MSSYRDNLKKNLALAEAFAAGEIIERYKEGVWKETVCPDFTDSNLYRVKPPDTGIVPFTFKDVAHFIGLAVILKFEEGPDYSQAFIITKAAINGVYIGSGTYYSYENLLYFFTFLDGSPCGKLDGEGNKSN